MILTADSALPWLIDVDVFEQAVSHVNWDTLSVVGGVYLLSAVKVSSGAQNANIAFDVVLAKGTWTVEIMHDSSTDRGVFSVRFDGVEKGTVDSYSSPAAYNNLNSVSGIVVSQTAKIRLSLQMATKNASSSSYVGALQHIQLRRTA